MLSKDERIRKNPRLASCELAEGGGAVVLHLETGAYHGLNRTGAQLWALIDESPTVAELQRALHARISAPPDRLGTDVVRFLERLRERDLLV